MFTKLFSLLFLNFLLILPVKSGWVEQSSGVSVQLNSVSASFENVWACGNNGTVLKSTNFGINWINLTGNGIPLSVNLMTIKFFSPTIVLAAGNSGGNTYVYRTSNSGTNWTQVFMQAGGSINGITYTLMQGNPVGGRWSLWRTANMGLTWDSTGMYLPQNGTETGFNNSLYSEVNYFWFGTNNSRIYYSFSAGNNWIAQSTTPLQASPCVWFEFVLTDIPLLGFAGGSLLLKCNNPGSNWSVIPSPGAGIISGISGIMNGDIKFISIDNKIYISTNDGVSWALDYTAPSGNYRHISLFWGSESILWAVRDNGGISKYPGTIGINQISEEIPESFYLAQNYPNPFNPSTSIKFSLPNPSKGGAYELKLNIYDISGREVYSVNETKTAGEYSFEFDGANLSSGIYFYKIEVRQTGSSTGKFRDTKKMILLK